MVGPLKKIRTSSEIGTTLNTVVGFLPRLPSWPFCMVWYGSRAFLHYRTNIRDASRRQPPTQQDFGCISFVWGSSREIFQKVDVVWFKKLQSLWWSSQLGDSNVHLEATAMLLVAGSWGQVDYRKPYWHHPGAKFGHFVGDVEAKSGYGRSCWSYMSDVVRPCCWACVPKCSPPEAPRFLSRFWQAMLDPFWGQLQGSRQHFGPRLGPSLATLGPALQYLEATALLLAAKLGDLEGRLGYRGVMLKLSWAMLCYVEAICQILFAHVVGFASWNARPLAGPSYVGSIGGSSTAILWLCWRSWDHLGINFGHLGARDDLMWAQFGGYNSGIAKNHPRLYLQNSPPSLEA